MRGKEAISAFIVGVQRVAPPNLTYQFANLNGQQAVLARTEEGQPYFALFVYGNGRFIQTIYVIAGEKLKRLRQNDQNGLSPTKL